jgi:hypothetical protein
MHTRIAVSITTMIVHCFKILAAGLIAASSLTQIKVSEIRVK